MAKVTGGNNPKSDLAVDRLGRALIYAQTESNDRLANRSGLVWSITADVGASVNSYFFYLKTNSTTAINITDIRVSSDTAGTTLFYRQVTGTPTPTGAVASEILNRDFAFDNELDADVIVAASMTGLTSLGRIFFEKLPTANKREKLSTTSNIIIPQGKAIAFFTDTAATLTFTVSAVQEILPLRSNT
jgi:uncharacterized membrane protein